MFGYVGLLLMTYLIGLLLDEHGTDPVIYYISIVQDFERLIGPACLIHSDMVQCVIYSSESLLRAFLFKYLTTEQMENLKLIVRI